MTTEERKSFDDFITRNRLMSEAKNKFICQHLGIRYRKEDFDVSEKDLAEEWAKDLPDRS